MIYYYAFQKANRKAVNTRNFLNCIIEKCSHSIACGTACCDKSINVYCTYFTILMSAGPMTWELDSPPPGTDWGRAQIPASTAASPVNGTVFFQTPPFRLSYCWWCYYNDKFLFSWKPYSQTWRTNPGLSEICSAVSPL